jgi:tRNA(Ile)-lysidine synthase
MRQEYKACSFFRYNQHIGIEPSAGLEKHVSLKTLLRIVKEHNLLPPSETVIVAVSGGTDSLALLHMLYRIRDQLEISLHVATFDHGLRPDSADDVRFVCQLATELELPCTTDKLDVSLLARANGEGIELAARQARYAFLSRIAREFGADRIAVGHHADDQAETVLMHILRGTGMQGLQGMRFEAPAPGAPDLKLVRPLLTIPKATLTAYCQQHGLHPRQDSSNIDERYSRNYIRQKVLPFLKSFNPKVDQALIRLAEITSVDQDYLESEYARCVLPHVHREHGRIRIDREAFRSLHQAMQRRFIHRSALDLGYEGFGQVHILHAIELGLRGDVGAVAQLPHDLQMRVAYDSLVLEDAGNPAPESGHILLPHKSIETPVTIPGTTAVPNADWSLKIDVGENEAPGQNMVAISPESSVILRSRRPGDRFAPAGMRGKTQSVKKWMINRKVPRHLRNCVPLLVVDGEIAAILVGEQWIISHKFELTRREEGSLVVSLSIVG